uniref:RNA-dependent RNA polymerase n=1 Tax=Lactarius rufus RNA virus 1 TaxID=1803570 RepID=A0A7L8Y1N3_9VIRU|nr:RNA-dependent RNA polymerase [Lactarius rufus RNA virus 1]
MPFKRPLPTDLHDDLDDFDARSIGSAESFPSTIVNSAGSAVGFESPRKARFVKQFRRKKFRKYEGRVAEAEAIAASFQHIQVSYANCTARKVSGELKFSDPCPFFKEFLDTEGQAYRNIVDLDNFCFMRACDAAQLKHLHYFDRLPREFNNEFYGVRDDAMAIVEGLILTGEEYQFPTTTDLYDVPFKPNKYPGFEYARQGYKTRKEADPVATADAILAFNRLLDGGTVDPHKVRLGGRGKVVAMSREKAKETSTIKGRLILMLSQRDLKILGATEKILTNHCKRWSIPIYVGNSFFFKGSEDLCSILSGYSRFYCFDAEKFDAAIDPWMIDVAVGLVRSLFVDGLTDTYDNYWDFVKNTLLYAPIVRDDGVIFYKRVGTTSGHSHNSLLQSIITIMTGYMVLIANNPDLSREEIYEHSYVVGLGDDNLIATRDPIKPMTCEEGAALAMKLTGINWSGSKSFETGSVWDLFTKIQDFANTEHFQGVQFLGKYFRGFMMNNDEDEVYKDEEAVVTTIIPYRPFDETMVRLYYPEREPSMIARRYFTMGNLAYLRACGHYIDAAGYPVTREMLDLYLDWLEKKEHGTSMVMEGDVLRKVFGSDANEAVKPKTLKRMHFGDWVRLVVLDRPTCERALLAPPQMSSSFNVFSSDESADAMMQWEEEASTASETFIGVGGIEMEL